MKIPYVSYKQIKMLDEFMVEQFGVEVVMMMEEAGYRIAEFIRDNFSRGKLIVCAGKGNNGGDGLAAARHLKNFGYDVEIFLITKELANEPMRYLKIAELMNINLFTSIDELKLKIKSYDLVIDSLIGYSLSGAPRGIYKEAIEAINTVSCPVVACDIPSGVDTDHGTIYEPYVRATHILFLSLPKQGCKNLLADKYVGDIGVPRELYESIGVAPVNYFQDTSILRLD